MGEGNEDWAEHGKPDTGGGQLAKIPIWLGHVRDLTKMFDGGNLMTVATFLATCEGKWHPVAPASAAAIAALIEKSGLVLPADYLEFLGQCNGGDGFLDVQPCYFRVWSAEVVVDYNLGYEMAEYVPGFFAFGDAGGSEFFAFDTRGSQPWPIVAIPYVPMEAESALSVARTFSELLEHLVPPDLQ